MSAAPPAPEQAQTQEPKARLVASSRYTPNDLFTARLIEEGWDLIEAEQIVRKARMFKWQKFRIVKKEA